MYLKENGTLGSYRRDYQDHCMDQGTSCIVKNLRQRLKNLKLGQQVCRNNTKQLNGQGVRPKVDPQMFHMEQL